MAEEKGTFEEKVIVDERGFRIGKKRPEEKPQEGARKRSLRKEAMETGAQFFQGVKELVHEGNIRRIVVKNEEGRPLLKIPLSLGLVGSMVVPLWAALGTLGALASGMRFGLEKSEQYRSVQGEKQHLVQEEAQPPAVH